MKEYYFKLSKIYLWSIIGFLLIMSGALMNLKVVEANDCRMPVYKWAYFDTDKHFSFYDKEKINFWFLADIIGIEGRFKLSIGDLFLFIGTTIFIYTLISSIILDRKFKVLLLKNRRKYL